MTKKKKNVKKRFGSGKIKKKKRRYEKQKFPKKPAKRREQKTSFNIILFCQLF